MNRSISKRKLWHYVNLMIHRTIHHYHVFSVISILFDEILIELKNKGQLKINNLGILTLKKMKPRSYFNIIEQKVMRAEGNRILRFTLAPLIRKKIVSHLDISGKGD